jgi:hypothetical protein
MNTPPKISFACPIPWSEMKGSDVSRHCEACGHTIHNLSSLTLDQRGALLRRAQVEKICGSYFVRLSGELVTPESPLSPREVRGIRQVGIAALSAGALALAAGCVSHPSEKKAEPQGPPEQVESKSKPEDKDETIQLVGFIINTDEAKPADIPKEKK